MEGRQRWFAHMPVSPLVFRTAVLVAVLYSNAGAADTCPAAYDSGQLDHWATGTVFYQVFVRSFADSDGDGIGDFNGLTARLDYLNDGDSETTSDLGIDGVWLMPITRSPSYHGYDTTDYDTVEEDYGTEDDFQRFVEEAHRRGIRVVMDLVVNHLSWQHQWFTRASRSTDDPYHDWFVWRPDDPGWTQPWSASQTWHRAPGIDLYYYGLFWAGMPDLNYENPAVRQEMIDIAIRWLDRGVDGFRLDASRHIIEAGVEEKAAGSPETHQWWREFTTAIRDQHPQALLIGENWTTVEEIAPFYDDAPLSQLDMNFNFDLSASLVDALRTDTVGRVQDVMCRVATEYPSHALDAIFLTNHDMIRVLTQLRDNRERARLGASLLLTLPGVPFIYYGEEIGMRNGPGDEDPEKRTPMQWTDEGGFTTGQPWYVNRKADPEINVERQSRDAGSLLNHYRRFIRLRGEHPALSRGTYKPATVDDASSGSVMAFERRHDDTRLLVVANFSPDPAPVVEIAAASTVELNDKRVLVGSVEVEQGDGTVELRDLPARSLVILVLSE